MSNFSIVLCAVIFVSGVDSFFWPDPVKIAQDNVIQIINTLNNEVKEKSEAVVKEAKMLLNKLMMQKDELVAEINHVEKKSAVVDKKIAVKTNAVKLLGCDEWANNMNNSAYAVISKVTSCFTEKVKTGLDCVEKIITIPIKVLSNLTDIAKEVRQCGGNGKRTTSLPEATACVATAAVKATWVSTVGVPEMVIHITGLYTLLATLQPALITCHVTRGFEAFFKASPIIIQGASECFKQKMDDLQKKSLAISDKNYIDDQ